MNATTKQKRTLKRFLAEAWPQINAVASERGDGSHRVASTKETHRNYFAWCHRRKLDSEDKRSFFTYFGLFNPSKGRIRHRDLSPASFEQRFGSNPAQIGAVRRGDLQDFWQLSLVAQTIDWHEVKKTADDVDWIRRNRHDCFPTYKSKISVEARVIIPESPRVWQPRQFYKVEWKFSIPKHWQDKKCRVFVSASPTPYTSLDEVITDLLIGLHGFEFMPRSGREIITTIQLYKYRTKKSINKCIEFEHKRGKFRSTEPHY